MTIHRFLMEPKQRSLHPITFFNDIDLGVEDLVKHTLLLRVNGGDRNRSNSRLLKSIFIGSFMKVIFHC